MATSLRALLFGFLVLAMATACADPTAAMQKEEAVARSLVHPDDSVDAIYEKLTPRGYRCTRNPQDIFCVKDIGLKGSCAYSVHVAHVTHAGINPDGLAEFKIWAIPACLR